jgi:hypothetical protein
MDSLRPTPTVVDGGKADRTGLRGNLTTIQEGSHPPMVLSSSAETESQQASHMRSGSSAGLKAETAAQQASLRLPSYFGTITGKTQ